MSETDLTSSATEPGPQPDACLRTRPLSSDSVFGGVLSTQFLGAFNDNFFKQMVLLKCTELAATSNHDLQPLALAAFALPFVLLSGIGGYISDRFSKRGVIVGCKIAEIAVMAAALQVLLISGLNASVQLRMLIVVLALMGAQSAIFGPAKYGILPELFSSEKLLPVNGAIQMTTFLAIIFGMAGAGVALDNLNNSLWLCSMIAVGIAVVGTGTSLFIRQTPVAEPQLKLKPGNLFIPGDVWGLFRKEPRLARAILVMMLFWFIGGVAQPAVNTLGENVFHLSKTRTSLMAACIGIGIAIGCVVSGFANRRGATDGARWTTRGSWMIVGSLLVITLLASGAFGRPQASADQVQGLFRSILWADGIEWLLRLGMLLLGLSAGIFVIPVQVYVQETPPPDQKGRLIGAMNFVTWIGILLSAVFLAVMNSVTRHFAGGGNSNDYHFVVFLTLAVIMGPVAYFYRLPTTATAMNKTEKESTSA